MKFGLITPPRAFTLASKYGLAYHMALVQYVLEDPQYSAYYKALHRQGHFIMLDNGAAERGRAMSIREVCVAASMVGADEIVMPDVLDDCPSTLTATQEALDFVPVRMRAVVPQGRDWAEWQYCLATLVAVGCRTICVAKRYEGFLGGRAHALDLIRRRGWDKTHDVHLLGCYRDPLEEMRNTPPWVRGIDTAAPIAYAQYGALLTPAEHHSLVWDAPFSQGIAERNVELALEACRQCI